MTTHFAQIINDNILFSGMADLSLNSFTLAILQYKPHKRSPVPFEELHTVTSQNTQKNY